MEESPVESLGTLKNEVANWRAGKKFPNSPMPVTLWDRAADLANDVGVTRVCRELKIPATKLKAMVEETSDQEWDGGRSESEGNGTPELVRVAPIEIKMPDLAEHPRVPAMVLEIANGSRLSLFERVGGEDLAILIQSMGEVSS